MNVSSLLETFNSSLSKLNALCPPSKFEWLPTTCVWKRPYLVKATALLASGPCHKFIIGWHFMIWEKASCWPSLGPFTRYVRHIRTCLHSNEKILKKLMTYKLIMYLSDSLSNNFQLYRVSHSKPEKVILLWWGHRFWFLLIFWVLHVH